MKNIVTLFGIIPIFFPPLILAIPPGMSCTLPGSSCPTNPFPVPSSIPFDSNQCYTEEKKNITIKLGEEFCIKLDKGSGDYSTEWGIDDARTTKSILGFLDQFSFSERFGGEIETTPRPGGRFSTQAFLFKSTLVGKDKLLLIGSSKYSPTGTPDFSLWNKPSPYPPQRASFNITVEPNVNARTPAMISVDFTSICCGIDHKTEQKLLTLVKNNYPQVRVAKTNWGLEGEITYTFSLESLSSQAKEALLVDIKSIVKEGKFVNLQPE